MLPHLEPPPVSPDSPVTPAAGGRRFLKGWVGVLSIVVLDLFAVAVMLALTLLALIGCLGEGDASDHPTYCTSDTDYILGLPLTLMFLSVLPMLVGDVLGIKRRSLDPAFIGG